MRNLMRIIARPGIYIAVVGLLVLLGGSFLWRGMVASPENGVADSLDAKPRMTASTAFREQVEAHLESAIKQTDFAIVQAMLRCNMPLNAAVTEVTEVRHYATKPYHFQRIRLKVESDPILFIMALRESLRTWAANATIASIAVADSMAPSESLWTISLDSVVTHELVFVTTSQLVQTQPEDAPRRGSYGAAPRMAIVIDDIGESMVAANALAKLSFPVAFAIWPRSTHARKTAKLGHAAGLEILIHQPTEPMGYPELNPGPGALLTTHNDREIEMRVRDSLTRVPYATGMNNHMGSRFTRDRRAAAAMVRLLKEHGFFVLDSMTHPASVLYAEARLQGIPALKRDVFLDSVPGKGNVLRQLRKAERMARNTGSVVVIGHPLPDTVAALEEWGSQRDTQIAIVKLSSLLFTP